MNIKKISSIKDRRNVLERELSIRLPHIGNYSLDEKKASSFHCENMIGVAQIPLGIAGPVFIQNLQSKNNETYIPLATTEGALVASVNRGCKVITQSGGAQVFLENVGVTRGPVFKTVGLKQSMMFKTYLNDHFPKMVEISTQGSSHIRLTKFDVQIVGVYVYVRFYFDTQNAMGMNMATIATSAIASYLERQTGIKCMSLAGNFDVDKKPAWLNMLSGRGKKVWAEVLIPDEIVEKILKTTKERFFETWLSKCMLGSAMSGAMGYNAHFANIVSALFLATGQDVAHTVEGSGGITTTEIRSDCLYVSIYMPDVMVGVIGGGTTLETQKEALSILGINNADKGASEILAKICAVAVLAGEISLLASLSESSLARAHQKLARGGK